MKRVPFAVVVPTLYGPMIVNRHDINQTNALFKTGRANDHAEIDLLAQILRRWGTDLTVLDVGANFGTYSLALVDAIGDGGKIHAFEAQRNLFNMLAGSVALNGHTNIHCHNMAVGDREGTIPLPQFDYDQPLNFGSVELGPVQSEPLSQERRNDPARAEEVPLTTIDRFAFQRVGLIKIDVEGMEMAVLDGAEDTIRRCRPLLYVEFLKSDAAALRRRLEGLDYTVQVIAMNYLCIPREDAGRITIQFTPPGQPQSR